MATLLVLFAALLHATPAVPSSISIRLAAAVVYCADDARDEQPESSPSPRRLGTIVDTPAPLERFVAADLAFALFQRPPPFVS